MLTQYSQDKFPPAPILSIQLSAPEESPQTEFLPALVDTGSDFTLVPQHWLLQIDAPYSRPALVRGLWSSQQEIDLFLVDIHLEKGILPGVEVVGVPERDSIFESEEIILGRNLLNLLFLLLEGPAQQTCVLERRPLRF